MSRLEKLIAELCPDGVEFKPIKAVYKRLKGTPITAGKMKGIENPEGEIRIFAGGKTVIDAKENDIPNVNIIKMPAVLVQSRGIIDVIYYDKPFTFKNEMWAYTTDDAVAVKFLYYVLKNNIQKFRSAASVMGSMPQISLPVTEEFMIPVLPMEVQREIVRILDNFSEKSTELCDLLSAELVARKKQYEYYREKLLTFAADVPRVALGEIGTFTRGNGLQKKDFTDSGVPCIHYGQIYTYYGNFVDKTKSFVSPECAKSLRKAKKGDLIITTTSENLEDVCKCLVWLGDGEVCYGGHSCCFSHNQDPKFIAYFLQTEDFFSQKKKFARGTKVIEIKSADLEKIEVPLPPISEQKRIADILDRFESRYNDLSVSIPAEIAARKKQYEYYRDRLLTFREKIAEKG